MAPASRARLEQCLEPVGSGSNLDERWAKVATASLGVLSVQLGEGARTELAGDSVVNPLGRHLQTGFRTPVHARLLKPQKPLDHVGELALVLLQRHVSILAQRVSVPSKQQTICAAHMCQICASKLWRLSAAVWGKQSTICIRIQVLFGGGVGGAEGLPS